MIALITPTGARPKPIELCAKFMHRQDYEGNVLWVIIDDALPETTGFIKDDFHKRWQIEKIIPEKKWAPGMNTQARNLLLGINVIKQYDNIAAVAIIEDDDFYKACYLSTMIGKLNGYSLAGEKYTIYYNPLLRRWYRCPNFAHSSLFQTMFSISVLPMFEKICQSYAKFIDIQMYRRGMIPQNKINLFQDEFLSVGIKGLPGRFGIGMGYKMGSRMKPDPQFKQLQQWIGDDYKFYLDVA